MLAVTGVPGETIHFYFGAVNGGVWETHDAGRTWVPIFDDQPVASIGATDSQQIGRILVHPTKPRPGLRRRARAVSKGRDSQGKNYRPALESD